ncbi:MAG: 4-alpha-glucanotransferase [Thermomicrobiales bacterium]|nr:4-alpha-glucanotransferase [Thermomicrobiales bacterium]
MRFDRSSGILLHPTSFPGPHGVGDLGAQAYRFVDWLERGRQRLWQVLPLGPTGYGNSPYASPSAFAGNPLLISLDLLRDQGLLTDIQLTPLVPFPDHEVSFDDVAHFKSTLLWDAFRRAREPGAPFDWQAFERFREQEGPWLSDFALFMALKESQGNVHWLEWPQELRKRSPEAMIAARIDLAEQIAFHEFAQFVFRDQWLALKRYANDRGIRIVGDIPIYVAADSVDVWANQDEFRLDDEGRPTVVTGVPPDYFSVDGQLWGNPLFDWPRMAQDGFRWWRERVEGTFELVDIIRIDHFRGFAAGWVVPAGDDTARGGRWERGPGEALLSAIDQAHEARFILEDLGLITPDVHALRRNLDMPGMKVLQFAFDGDPRNSYLPHNFEPNCAVYPGTHDNQTTIGWFSGLNDHQRRFVQGYLGTDGSDIAWDLMRQALASVADLAICPLQDVMRLSDEARMNTPGLPSGNWGWRYLEHQLHDGLADGLADLTATYGRAAMDPPSQGFDPYDYSVPGAAHPLHEPGA